jgi:hypothetical protein
MDSRENSSAIAFLLREKGICIWALIANVSIVCAVGMSLKQSEPGKGSSFEFFIPYVPARAGQARPA